MTDSPHAGVVVRQQMGHHFVESDGVIWDCHLSSRLGKQLVYPQASAGSRRHRVERVRGSRVTHPVTIGDNTRFEPGDDNTGMILEILPRRNKISRRTSGTSNKEQLLAANIDRVIPIFAATDPVPEWTLLDRMVGIAEWQEIPAVICINKVDLDADDEVAEMAEVYRRVGYKVLFTSTVSDAGQADLRAVLAGGTSLFMGPSGVGKSSLINWLQPGLELRTGEVGKLSREGRHTTSHLELVRLDGGGLVGDIPGVREFKLWNIEPDDVPSLFREFHPHLGGCRFNNCTHVHEPGCPIKEAVEAGEIDRRRYASYLQLRDDP